jgi:type I restriction enzyme S subunit
LAILTSGADGQWGPLRVHEHHVFLYGSLRHWGESGFVATLFTGATSKHLRREKLAKVTLLIPPAELMDAFLERAAASEKQMLLLESANGRVAEARDLRCPRLMSGEIEV